MGRKERQVNHDEAAALRANDLEPEIVIAGVLLTEAQSMAVRVAVGSMLLDLAAPEYMRDLGEIGPLYQSRLYEVQLLMHGASAHSSHVRRTLAPGRATGGPE
jgi:hypothetical protein